MKTGIFIIDDSVFVRRALTRVLATEPDFHIVGEAASGIEALEKIPAADPDFVTLDVEMPGMGGLELLPALLKWKSSLRVVMLSAHTQEGAAATVAALGAGALDVIDKTTFNVMDLEFLRREVVERLKALAPRTARSDTTFNGLDGLLPTSVARAELRRCELCVIGASTGGPSAVQRILQSLPIRLPFPVIVVQHMPEGFTGPFAQRLNSIARVPVAEAVEGERLIRGPRLRGEGRATSAHRPFDGCVIVPRSVGCETHPERGRDDAIGRAIETGTCAGHSAHRHGRGRSRRDGRDPGGRRHHDCRE